MTQTIPAAFSLNFSVTISTRTLIILNISQLIVDWISQLIMHSTSCYLHHQTFGSQWLFFETCWWAYDNITEKHSSRSIYIPSFLAAAGVIQFTRQTNNILLLCKCTTRFVLIRESYKNKFPFPNGGVSCTYFVAFCNWKYKADFWLSLRI